MRILVLITDKIENQITFHCIVYKWKLFFLIEISRNTIGLR